MYPLTRATNRTFLLLAMLAAATPAVAETPTVEQLWQVIQSQQKQIDRLESQIESTDRKLEATGDMIEQTRAAAGARGHHGGRGKTTVSGYGELHYKNLDSGNEVDFHRFVLEFGHEFSDSIRFYSELELEHALAADGEVGEVEIEQAYIEFDINDRHRLRAGLDLIPVGILNQTHEPETFYAVERNPVEKNIIPTTWWEAGVSANGELAPGWYYAVMLSSGLETPADFKIRSGRNKVSKATANDGAITGRLKYTGLTGIELATTVQHQADITQGALGIAANLLEAHVVANRGQFGLRALWAGWWLDDGEPGTGPAATGRDKQTGWYIEPSYRFTSLGGLPGEAGVFVRYNQWDNNAGSAADTVKSQLNIGLNWWPHANVVLKFDYQNQMDSIHDDGFNLGLGYSF